VQPELAVAWFNLGNVFSDAGFGDKAISCWRTCVARDPSFMRAWLRLCEAHWKTRDVAQVAQLAHSALVQQPTDLSARAWWYAAKCVQAGAGAKPPPVAGRMLAQWLQACPPDQQLALLTAIVEHDERAGQHALEVLRSIAREPDADYVGRLASMLMQRGQVQDAVPWLNALAAHESNVQSETVLGFGAQFSGEATKARNHFEAAVKADAENPEAWVNLGLLDLMEHRWEEAWAHAEWRSHPGRLPGPGVTQDLRNGKPKWSGDPAEVSGKVLLVAREQGLGDTLLYARFVRDLVDQVGPTGKVRLAVYPGQGRLLASLHPAVEVVEATNEQLPQLPCDLWCHLMSLPFLLRVRDIQPLPRYLATPEVLVEQWRLRLGAIESGARSTLRVGLCWAGGPLHPARRHRSIPLEEFAGLAREVPGASFFGFVVGAASSEVARVDDELWVHDLSPGLTDFAETAAALSHMDVLISVDTAVAHLGAALGIPTWVPLSNLPFFSPIRTIPAAPQTPWYTSMRMFNQEPGDTTWTSVMNTIGRELRTLTEPRTRKTSRKPTR